MRTEPLGAEHSRREASLAILAGVSTVIVAGFWPSYFRRLPAAAFPTVIHVHAGFMLAWCALGLGQAALARRRLTLHRALGWSSIAIALGVVGSALAVIRWSTLRDLEHGRERAVLGFLLVSLSDVLLFASFWVAALVYRRRAHVHPKLIVAASCALLPPAVARIAARSGWHVDPLLAAMGALDLGLLALFVNAAVKRRRAAAVYLVCALTALALHGGRALILDGELWQNAARRLVSLSRAS